MSQITFAAQSEDDTGRLGNALASVVPDGTTISLCGTLGAGKTRLVRSLAAACGIASEDVVSPTFVLCQEYHGNRSIVHLDAYRIADEDEFLALGAEEHFESKAITLVEWGDRIEGCLPDARIEINILVTGDSSREFIVRAIGKEYEIVIQALKDLLCPS